MGLVPKMAQLPYIYGDVFQNKYIICAKRVKNLKRHFFVKKRERGDTYCVLLIIVFGWIGPNVATTGASLWWRMLARFSSKSWPTDLATSAKKLESSPQNSAVSDPNARQPI